MSNITSNIENLLSHIEDTGSTGPIMASIAWSFAMSLAQSRAALIRLDMDDDPETAAMSFERRNERREQVDKRIAQTAQTLSWAVSYATPEYVPSGEDVAERIVGNDPETYGGSSEANSAQIAEVLGMSVEEVEVAAEDDRQRQIDSRRRQQDAIKAHQKEVVQLVDDALNGECYQDFELSDRDAKRILERIAEKCEKYEQNKVQAALKTRRQRRLAKIAADRQLLNDAQNKADALQDTLDVDSDESVAKEAEVDHRIVA